MTIQRPFWALLLGLLLTIGLANAQEDTAAPELPAEMDQEGEKFTSRELLIKTWLGDREDLSGLEQAVADAQQAVDNAADDITDEELGLLNQALMEAQASLTEAQTAQESERIEIEELVDQLSDEQVFALNRSLNNTRHNRFGLVLDAGQLQVIIDGDYDKHQINAFTKALEEEHKFKALAEKFVDKTEATGNDKFLVHADRMLEKGLAKSERFLNKAERGSSSSPLKASSLAQERAQVGTKETARSASKNIAKLEAKAAAREAAKELRKEQTKEKGKGKK